MKKIILIILAILLLGAIGSCVGGGDDYDDAMGSYDWGPNHYYDSNANAVREKAW